MDLDQIKREIINGIINLEGDYSDHEADLGGKTKFGITEFMARNFGYKGSMVDLTKSKAEEIYSRAFWEPLHLDRIAVLSKEIAAELMDTSVNCGQFRAATFLQRALNAFNREGTIYDDLIEDGVLGTKTTNALRSYLSARKQHGAQVMLRALNALQAVHYLDLAKNRLKNEQFVFGWIKNRVSNVCQ